MDSRYASWSPFLGSFDGRDAIQRAVDAVQHYRAQLGMKVVLPSNCRCSILNCDHCERRIGAFGEAEFDPLVLMAIAEVNRVTLKLTPGPHPFRQHFVVCVLDRREQPLITDEGEGKFYG